VSECFDICIIESKDGCAPTLFKRGDNVATSNGLPAVWDQYIPEGTLLRRIIDCLFDDIKAITDRVGTTDSDVLGKLGSDDAGKLIAAGVTPAQAYAAVCKFKAAIMDMLAADTHPVCCQMRKAAAEITLTAPGANPPADTYFNQAKDALQDLVAVWIQLLLDCICRAFLPQCDADPCHDRVEIA